MPAQSTMRKSASSRRNILPYLKSASSKLNISALSSTGSITALFTSATQDRRDQNGAGPSPSKQSIFTNGIRGLVGGRDKENENASPSAGRRTGKSGDKGRKHAYPEISAPTLTDEALAAVKARFTLIPINGGQPSAVDESEEGFSIIREESFVHIDADKF